VRGINEWHLDVMASWRKLTTVVRKSDAKGGKEALAVRAFIAGGERGSWQQAHMSASTVDVEAVQRQ
jgi:hypothetical protein